MQDHHAKLIMVRSSSRQPTQKMCVFPATSDFNTGGSCTINYGPRYGYFDNLAFLEGTGKFKLNYSDGGLNNSFVNNTRHTWEDIFHAFTGPDNAKGVWLQIWALHDDAADAPPQIPVVEGRYLHVDLEVCPWLTKSGPSNII
jgi:hypothetical protein